MTGKRRARLCLAIGTGVVALALAAWRIALPGGPPATPAAQPLARAAPAVKPAGDGFDQVLEVLARGGTTLERERAICFLDTISRVGKGLAEGQRAALIAALEHGTPAGMAEGSWFHLFNSACNALAVAQPAGDETLLGLLEHVALADPRLIMRLYALQHIGRHYAAASPTTRQRLRTLVRRLLDDPSSQTAGTALVLWSGWEKTAGPGDMSFLDLSRSIATDAGRPVDVRVTALHAIGGDPGVLDVARAIAPDRRQPAILRKAALNLIGRHGEERDLDLLRLCSRESSRLAQAGEPAAHALESRLAGIHSPVLRPY